MLDMMSRNWWMLLIRGFAAFLFGVAVILLPGLTLAVLVNLLAAYLLVDGFFAIATAVTSRNHPRWWMTALEGVLGILAGIAAFLFPVAATMTFFYIVAFWAVMTGILEIVAAIELRRAISNEWWMILGGIVSILFGILLLVKPGDAILALLWVLGVMSIVFGVALIVLAFRVRTMRGGTPSRAAM